MKTALKNRIIFTLITCSILTFQAQHKTPHKAQKNSIAYMSLKQFKRLYKRPLTKADSTSFMFRGNDTLVKVENYKRAKGVSVAYEYKDSTFLSLYKKVAFNHKNDSINEKTTMKYWKKPIKIFLSKSIKRKTKKEFIKFALQISQEIDSLNISFVKKIEESNYIIYYNHDFEYESRMVNYKTTNYYLNWNNKNQSYRCALKINIDNNFNEKLRLYALKDYFFRSLGRFKLSNKFLCESYFSDCYSDHKKLSSFDFELLKYHYSYGICKGTTLKIFEEQHKRSKEIYAKTGHKSTFIHSD
jgi:hypothetical protein